MTSNRTTETLHPMVRAVEGIDDSAYLLSPDWRILHTNKGWRAFAEANGGLETLLRWPVGSRIDDALPANLYDFYRAAYQSALKTGIRWEHEYDCSSPTEYRKFKMTVYPLDDSGLLVVNSLVVEVPYPDIGHSHDAIYRVDGFITMCANCRKTFNPRTDRWDWVSSYVETMPSGTSHGLCAPCVAFYYP